MEQIQSKDRKPRPQWRGFEGPPLMLAALLFLLKRANIFLGLSNKEIFDRFDPVQSIRSHSLHQKAQWQRGRLNELINDDFGEDNQLEEHINSFIRTRPNCTQIAPSELYAELARTSDIFCKMTDRRGQMLVKSHMTRTGWSLKRIAATKSDQTPPRRWCRS